MDLISISRPRDKQLSWFRSILLRSTSDSSDALEQLDMTAIRTSAAVANIVWALLIAAGMLVNNTSIAGFGFIFFGAIAARNSFAINSDRPRMDRPTVVMNIFLAIFALTAILASRHAFDRFGGCGLLIISAANVFALLVGKQDAWLKRFRPQEHMDVPEREVELTR